MDSDRLGAAATAHAIGAVVAKVDPERTSSSVVADAVEYGEMIAFWTASAVVAIGMCKKLFRDAVQPDWIYEEQQSGQTRAFLQLSELVNELVLRYEALSLDKDMVKIVTEGFCLVWSLHQEECVKSLETHKSLIFERLPSISQIPNDVV